MCQLSMQGCSARFSFSARATFTATKWTANETCRAPEKAFQELVKNVYQSVNGFRKCPTGVASVTDDQYGQYPESNIYNVSKISANSTTGVMGFYYLD